MRMASTIAINAQLLPGIGTGGVESVITALVASLGKLTDGEEEYVIIGHWAEGEWLRPYLGPNQRLVLGPRPENLRKGFAGP